MATLKIYRDNTELVEVNIGDDTIRESYFMGDDRIKVSFSYPEIIDFLPYDYIIHNGKRYSIKGNEMPTRKELGKRNFDYDIVFKSPEYRMHDMPLSHLGNPKVDYFGTPREMLQSVLNCMSSIDAGFVLEIDEPVDIEPKGIYFDNVTCRQAVTQICELFELEYNFDGHVLYVGKSVGNRLEGFTFSQGKGNGLYTLTEVSVPDSPFATRFYGFGGSENVPAGYKEGMDNIVMTGTYVERNIDLYGLIIQNVFFDDIYPFRTGTFTAVSEDYLSLTDASLDFDFEIEGAKLIPITGEVANHEFEITSYNYSTKTIKIKPLEESEGYFLPNSTFSPKVGDKYKLVGIIMPESYITAAENKVAEKTIEYAEKHSHPSVGFELELDQLELRRRGLVGALNVGTWIHVVSTKLSVDRYLRITELSYPLANPSKITAKISDVVSYTLAERILKDVSGNKNEIAAIEREQKRDFTILSRKSAEQAKLQAERLNELREYIFDADNYFDVTKIKPQSLETQMLSVGAKSQNFYLSGVTMQPNYLGDANRFYVSAGQLQHREISIDSGFIWNLTAQAFYALEPSKTYYLSAKCSKADLTATYSLSDAPKKTESEAGYYHFNIGVLYPVSADGKRYFANTSGVSYVVGSQITTGRLKSLDGNTWFDLDTGEIRGAIKFTSGQTVESAIEQAKGEAVAQSGVATQQAIAALSVGGRNLVKNSKNEIYFHPNDFGLGYKELFPEFTRFTCDPNKWISLFGYRMPDLILDTTVNRYSISIDIYVHGSSPTNVNLSGTLIQNIQLNEWVRIKAEDIYYNPDYVIWNGIITSIATTIDVKNIKIELGSKATDWTPAPEDLQQQIVDTDNARKAYIDAQDNLKEVEVKAYADGIVSAEEVRAIADATAKANAAKSYADAQDLLLKAQTDAYADGKVSAEESARIAQAQANLTAAQNYAIAQDNLAKTETKAYADGIVDAEEARAIADAQAKLNEAKSHADAQANIAQVNAIAASNQSISNAISALSVGGRNLIPYTKEFLFDIDRHNVSSYTEDITTPDGLVNKALFIVYNGNLSNYFRIENVVKEPNTQYTFSCWIGRQGYGDVFYRVAYADNFVYKDIVVSEWQKFEITFTSYSDVSIYDFIQFKSLLGAPNGVWIYQPKLEKGNKATDWTPAPEDFEKQIIDTDNARKAYIDAQDNLKEVEVKAYTDGKVSAEEARAIADATAKANAAKSYAEAQDLLLKAQTESYADGKVSAEESARIAQAVSNLNAAKEYAEAQDNLSKIETKAYADGIVDAEEARAIQDAQSKLNEAKLHADTQAGQAQVNAIVASNQNISNAINALSVGGRNLLLNSANVIQEGNDFHNSNNTVKGVITVNDNPNVWNSYSFLPLSTQFKIGEEVVYSVEVKSSKAIVLNANLMPHYPHNNFVTTLNLLPNVWTKAVCKGVITNVDNNSFLSGFSGSDASGAVINYKNFKIERGNKATDWTPAPEDLQQMVIDTDNARKSYIDAQDSLKEIQTKAYADGIVSAEEARAIADATAKANAAKSYADNLKAQTDSYINSVTTPIKNVVDEWTYAETTEIDGNKLRAGTVTADKINTLNLQARHIATSDNVDKLTINANNDNSIKIRHANGQVGIQMGLVGGVPKLVFFNEYGNKVWEGGMSGIVYVDNVPESWSPAIFKLLPGNHSNVIPDVNGNITSSEKAQLKNWINTSSGFLTTDFGGQPVISSGTTFYSYSAGINAQAENNRIYEGLHTSQLKSTGNWMPNGWYGQSGTALFQVSDYPVQVYATTLEYYANGKMIASILIDDITMI